MFFNITKISNSVLRVTCNYIRKELKCSRLTDVLGAIGRVRAAGEASAAGVRAGSVGGGAGLGLLLADQGGGGRGGGLCGAGGGCGGGVSRDALVSHVLAQILAMIKSSSNLTFGPGPAHCV